MAQRFDGDGWTIVGPPGWVRSEERDGVSFRSAAGARLRLSSHRKKGGEVRDEDLDEVASEHLDAGAPVRDVRLGDFVGFEVDFDAEGLSCREWFLRSGSLLLLASLTREGGSGGVEDEAAELALVSLEGERRGPSPRPRRRRP